MIEGAYIDGRRKTVRMIRGFLIAALCLIAPMVSNAEPKGSYFAIVVAEIETSSAWYQAALGLEPGAHMKEHGKFEIVNLSRPGLHVELIQLAAANEKPAGITKGPFKVGLVVDDLSEFVARLPDTVPEPEVVRDERNALLLIQLRDPDNNVIQVIEFRNRSGSGEDNSAKYKQAESD